MTTAIEADRADDELREACRTLAVEMLAPLPEGDLALVEAESRLAEYRARRSALHARQPWTFAQEEAIVEPILGQVDDYLDFILLRRRPFGMIGIAVKLRHILDEKNALLEDDGHARHSLVMILRAVEGEIVERGLAAEKGETEAENV